MAETSLKEIALRLPLEIRLLIFSNLDRKTQFTLYKEEKNLRNSLCSTIFRTLRLNIQDFSLAVKDKESWDKGIVIHEPQIGQPGYLNVFDKYNGIELNISYKFLRYFFKENDQIAKAVQNLEISIDAKSATKLSNCLRHLDWLAGKFVQAIIKITFVGGLKTKPISLENKLWMFKADHLKFEKFFYFYDFQKFDTVLFNLKSLELCQFFFGNDSIREEFKNFDKKYPNLKKLVIECDGVHKISGIENLKSLEYLKIRIINSLDTTVLNIKNLPKLKYFEYNAPPQSNRFFQLRRLPSLETLKLLDFKNFEFQSINEFRKLINLTVSGCYISKMSFWNNLINLQFLDLSSSEIDCLERFEYFINLKELILSKNHIKVLESLNCLKKLEKLDLSHNNIGRIEYCFQLNNLKILNLEFNEITDAKNLSNLLNLEDLNLSYNRIESLENLNNLKNLARLTLVKNEITNFKNLNKFGNLEELDLECNKIESLKGLTNFHKLEFISLKFNHINSLEIGQLSAEGCESLKNIDVSENSFKFIAHKNFDLILKS